MSLKGMGMERAGRERVREREVGDREREGGRDNENK